MINCYLAIFEIISSPFGCFGVLVALTQLVFIISDDLARRFACNRSIFFYLYFYQARSVLSGFSDLFTFPLFI